MTVYRIAKWDTVFERAESRKLKQLSWVAMPTGFTSHGYQSLLDEFDDRSAAIYGCWCALVAVAASCAVRGVLGTSRGNPLKISHLARMTGFQSADFESLMHWASSEQVGWLEPLSEAEIAKYFVANSENLNELDTSGDSPDDPPTPQEKPPSTQPDITKRNQTKHNHQLAAAKTAADADGNFDRLKIDGLDLQVVAEQAAKLYRAIDRRRIVTITREFIWETACIAELLRPGFLSEVSTKIINKDILKPQPYIEKALRDEAAGRGIDLLLLKKQLPPTPSPQPSPQRTATCQS